MHPISCVFDSTAATNLIRVDFLEQSRLNSVHRRSMLEVQMASETRVPLFETNTLQLYMGEWCTRLIFGVRKKLSLLILLWTVFINRFIKTVYPAERRIVRYYSLPVFLYKANTKAEKNASDIHESSEQNLIMMATPTWTDPTYTTGARQVRLTKICETSELVSTKAVGLIKITLEEIVAKRKA